MADLAQPPEDRALVERVVKNVDIAEPDHARWRKKADHYNALWNNYQDHKAALRDATSEAGRDEVRREAVSVFGSELFVPMAFGIVEAILPQMIANRPRMLATPRDQRSEINVENVQYTIDAQQQKMDYELKLQTIGKDGLICGLGAQKIYWKTDYRRRTKLAPSGGPRSINPTGWQQATTLEQVFDDPWAEAVDPYDLLWDPFASDVESAAFIIHRSWVRMDYIRTMAETGQWKNLDNIARVEGLGSMMKYDEAWANRMTALGYNNISKRGEDRMHEVLEMHTGDEVITVLDREICVRSEPNPHWHGEKPFQIFRPTEITHRFFGKGEIEPIEWLQREINELRRQRRDNAMFILQKAFAFHDGLVEVDDFKFGPGVGIPVNGDPRELLFPINVGDIPYAGYQEEQALKDDFQFTSGLSDPTADNPSQETATGAQLVYQATSRRVANKTRRLELEIIAKGTAQMHALNQQRIIANRDVKIESPPEPGAPDRRWAWKSIGPAELAGEFAWAPEGGSTMPENTPQQREDGRMIYEMFGADPEVVTSEVKKVVMRKMGLDHPEAYLRPDNFVPPETMEILLQAGVPEDVLRAALDAARAGEEMAQQGAPPEQPEQAPNGGPPPQTEPQPA